MSATLTPEDLKKKDAVKKAGREAESAPAGMPAFLQPKPATPEEAAASVPAAAPVVVVPVEKEEVR